MLKPFKDFDYANNGLMRFHILKPMYPDVVFGYYDPYTEEFTIWVDHRDLEDPESDEPRPKYGHPYMIQTIDPGYIQGYEKLGNPAEE